MNLLSFISDPNNWADTAGRTGIWTRLAEHLSYTGLAVAVAAIIAIPLGIAVGHTGRGNLLAIGVANAARAIPTLGLLVLVVTLLGTGLVPTLIPLVILAIPPILTATAAGIFGVDRDAVHAARALGMTGLQVAGKVEVPLALPLLLSGLRSATLQVVATATVAAYAAAGGLGRFVIDGQRVGATGYPQMFAGALLVAALAILLDAGLLGLGRAVQPGLK